MFQNKTLKKVIAVFALVGVVGSTSLINSSEAAVPSKPPTTHSRTANNPKPAVQKAPVRKAPAKAPVRNVRHNVKANRSHESHSDTGNLVTGLIIGGILGAVISANN